MKRFAKFVVTLAVLALLVASVMAQTASKTHPILLTKDNWKAVHSHFRLRPDWHKVPAGHNSAQRTQIGVFYEIAWPTGQAMYEFDWFIDNGQPCPPGCSYYSDSLVFSNIIVNVNGTRVSSGPLSESPYLGVAWFSDWEDSSILSNCQPLTLEPNDATLPAADVTSFQSSCIDAALQLVFPTDPYTFTLLDGTSFTTYGVNTSFVVPFLDHTDLYSYCDAYGVFCRGQTIPVYANEVKQKLEPAFE